MQAVLGPDRVCEQRACGTFVLPPTASAREARLTPAPQLDLPDWVMYHPIVAGLGDAANDLVTVSDLASFVGHPTPGMYTD